MKNKLIEADDLSLIMKQKSLVIFDIRPNNEYLSGHIPTATNISYRDFEDPLNSVDGELATPSQFEQFMRKHGVKNGDTIIVHSNNEFPQMATRLIWALQFYGEENTYLLNGHYQSWVEKGFTVSHNTPMRKKSDFSIQKIDSSINVDKNYVLSTYKKVNLIDARPKKIYLGKDVEDENKYYGHIPRAKNLFFKDFIDEDGKFLNNQRLEKLVSDLNPEKETIVYCQRGHRASLVWFVLEHLLGFKNSKVYDGSMIEWANTDGLPMEKY